ncbi:MAG: protein jag, partial [Dehalococcoidia bacterium]
EFLISFIIKRQLDKKVRVILDVEGYQERRRQNIASLAESAAEKVIKSGKPVKMDPMSPFDRRIVHLSLEKQSKITTESEGSGSRRQVVIKLK